eukprot:TRINITY_DN92204_c0_g1_i1.p1 TRINITY_DN92204_c0_g1~~TRINITY_DN92204_c0_g1_i1.p1  ORF type:complete len:335 (+),score=68.21 TRINITY_DN92204_c0_g1_i1:105-1007(+)
MASFMEAKVRKQNIEPPPRYGYKAVPAKGVGFWVDERTGCNILEQPVVIPSGLPHFQGYMTLFAYCEEEGLNAFIAGQLPPVLPATRKEPSQFQSLEQICENFGAKDPKAMAAKSGFCVVLHVPVEIANQAEVPGRDIWMINFRQDKITPFLQAAKEGNAEKVKTLLEAGCKGDAVDEDGVSALMIAASEDKSDICQALLARGASVDYAEPNQGRTALMFASHAGHAQTVSALLSAKADTAKVDREGSTALHWAAVYGKKDMIPTLLRAGCPKDAKNAEGLTALDAAAKAGHESTAAALK